MRKINKYLVAVLMLCGLASAWFFGFRNPDTAKNDKSTEVSSQTQASKIDYLSGKNAGDSAAETEKHIIGEVINPEYPNFTKDDKFVYYSLFGQSEKIDEADPATFQIIGVNYQKDKNSVYYLGSVIKGADPQTFEPLDYPNSKDKNHNYVYGIIASEGFKDIGWGYSKDSSFVYYQGTIINGVDPLTFKIISGNSGYTKDKNGVYRFLTKLENADPATFEILIFGYAKDKERVYWYDSLIEGADPQTFKAGEGDCGNMYCAKDKNHTYSQNLVLS